MLPLNNIFHCNYYICISSIKQHHYLLCVMHLISNALSIIRIAIHKSIFSTINPNMAPIKSYPKILCFRLCCYKDISWLNTCLFVGLCVVFHEFMFHNLYIVELSFILLLYNIIPFTCFNIKNSELHVNNLVSSKRTQIDKHLAQLKEGDARYVRTFGETRRWTYEVVQPQLHMKTHTKKTKKKDK